MPLTVLRKLRENGRERHTACAGYDAKEADMLTSKERFQRILDHQPVDRIGLFEVFWRETARKWCGEGHFQKPELISDHFGVDVRRTGYEITPVLWTIVDLMADLDADEQITEETETTKLVRNGNGALLRWGKDRGSAPEHVDFLVKDRKAWEECIRPRLLSAADYPRRIARELYRQMRADCAEKRLLYHRRARHVRCDERALRPRMCA